MIDSKNQLAKAFKEGVFLEVLNKILLEPHANRHLIVKEIANLHNEGKIDAIEQFCKLMKDSTEIDFFFAGLIFADVLPTICAPVRSVIECVNHLLTQAGSVLSKSWLLVPFIKFCKAELARSEEALKIAFNENNKLIEFISPAIIAGATTSLPKYVEIAINLLSHSDLEIRIKSTESLGKISFHNESLLNNAFSALKEVIQLEFNDRLFAATLKTSFALYLQDINLLPRLIDLVSHIVIHTTDSILHAASEILAIENSSMPIELIDLLFQALYESKPTNRNTLENINFTLLNLIKYQQEDKVFSFFETFIIKNDNKTLIENFNIFIRILHSDYNQAFNRLITRWLLSKKIPLCITAMEIVSLNNCVLFADNEQLKSQPEGVCLFATKKAIGWLFNYPISAISFIISLLDCASDAETQQITTLLFYPLLINHPSQLKEYIEGILPSQSSKSKPILNHALSMLETYHENLKATGKIPELRPAVSQREAYARLIHEQTSKIYKDALNNSIFFHTSNKLIVLYGRKTVKYILERNNQKKRIEIPLHNHNLSSPIPSLEYVDPHNLNYMLRVFQIEGGHQ